MELDKEQQKIIDDLKQILHNGTYETFRTAIATKQAELSLDGRQQESDLWKKGIGKQVTEPGFIKYVLQPLGIEAKLVEEGCDEDMVVAGRDEDLKLECAPYIQGSWGPVLTRSMDKEDVRVGGKYPDNFVFKLWTIRVPGLRYRFSDTLIVPYTGRSLDIVCETTVGKCRHLIKQYDLKPRLLQKRLKEEHQGQNETEMYDFDIRWFKMLWRYNYQTQRWEKSSWTEEEMAISTNFEVRQAKDEDDGEIPLYVSKTA
jgi:hypothetical protein